MRLRKKLGFMASMCLSGRIGKCISLVLYLALGSSLSICFGQNKPLRLSYTQPAKMWEETLPLGMEELV
jgi:hypothetical protein